MTNSKTYPIGVFDSGFGGLTVLKSMVEKLPQYDYIYLGDNARAPYGPRSFETVYQYTLEAVSWFFKQGCELVILACNTASAKALRTIQMKDLPLMDSNKRVLGVIRPTTELIGQLSQTKQVGILGTNGTIKSNSYPIEISKFYPQLSVHQLACPMFVPLIENQEHENDGADYFVDKYIKQLNQLNPDIDTILLACTHYPLLEEKLKTKLKTNQKLISQGAIVANSLENYLIRHEEIERKCSKGGEIAFYTTDSPEDFDLKGSYFYKKTIKSTHIDL